VSGSTTLISLVRGARNVNKANICRKFEWIHKSEAAVVQDVVCLLSAVVVVVVDIYRPAITMGKVAASQCMTWTL